MTRSPRVIFAVVVLVLLNACSSSKSGSGASVSANVRLTSNSVAMRNLAPKILDFLQLPFSRQLEADLKGSPTPTTAGGTTASSLTSLKYYFINIAVCEGLTTSGTAFNNGVNCYSVYNGPNDAMLNPENGPSSSSPDYAALSTYAATITAGYIDLMDPTSRATINASTATVPAGSYNWGYITWAYPIKFTASLNAGGTTLYSRSGSTANVSSGGGGFSTGITTASTVLTTSPAQEAIQPLPNGGTWIKFQNPFVISSTDTALTVDLTFNPDNLIKGFATHGMAGTPSNLAYYDGLNNGSHNAFSIPFIDLTPVPRRAGENTIVETYTTNNTVGSAMTGTTDTFRIRLELYYNSGDAAKSIYGATLRVLPSSTTTYSTDIQKIAFIGAGSTSGTLNFNDYASNPIISGFTRQTTIGSTTTATLPCTGSFTSTTFGPAGCSSGGHVSPTFALTSVNVLQ